MAQVGWEGVFPAVTTQFRENFSLDIEATRRVMDALIRDGVSGLIVCGTVGENCPLSRAGTIAVLGAAKDLLKAERATLEKAGVTDPKAGIEKLPPDEKTIVESDIKGDRKTLVADSFQPGMMALIYLALMIYFMSIGGYKAVKIDETSH